MAWELFRSFTNSNMLHVAKLMTSYRANVLYWTRANIDGYRTRDNIFLFFNCKIFPLSRFFNLKYLKKGALEPWCYTALPFWKMFTNFIVHQSKWMRIWSTSLKKKSWYNVLILTAQSSHNRSNVCFKKNLDKPQKW